MSAVVYQMDIDIFDSGKPLRMQQIEWLIFTNVDVCFQTRGMIQELAYIANFLIFD